MKKFVFGITVQKTKKTREKPVIKKQKSEKTHKMSQKFLVRQEKIKAVALKLFITKGYEDTSLKDIIKKSGGSYSDIYTTFKNKQGLFVNVIEDVLDKKRVEYGQIFKKNLSLHDTLYTFSINIMNTFLQKETLALVKIIYSQLYNQSNRILVEHFENNKEKIPERALIDYFKSCPKPLCDEAEKYAELFFAMLKGSLEKSFFYEIRIIDKEEQEKRAKFVVDFFIKALQ